ncbi:metallophosphoesterase [Luteolibacter luteus]|uniref:Phosphatase n=1 Tax=Luteolibacter luteus TaxID=2728835 RepID=A0A858RFX1_9BACT|nr:metallophosphoesterase [Luteolibacter luteus]QJE95491.1 phosphatase [Luteolibacter luteus]
MNRRAFLGSTTTALLPLTTLAEEGSKPVLRFGLIADAQYADADPEGERHYRTTPGKMKEAVEVIRAAKPEFTLHLGDFIDRDFKSFDVMLPLISGLGHPIYHLLGNHDYSIADAEKARVVSTLGMPHDYYTFRSGSTRFVMLDTNDLSTYRDPKDSLRNKEAAQLLKKLEAAQAPGAKPWNGGLSKAQLEWLDRELSAASAAKEKVILCGHHPLIPAEMHQAWQADEVLAVIDKHDCVRAYFNGHNHAGAFVERKGIPYVTFRSMLHEPGINAYSVVDVFDDRIVITGHGRAESRVLAV